MCCLFQRIKLNDNRYIMVFILAGWRGVNGFLMINLKEIVKVKKNIC